MIGNEPTERLKVRKSIYNFTVTRCHISQQFVEALLGHEPQAMTEAEDASMIKAYEVKVDGGSVILLDVPMLDGRGGLRNTLRSLRSYLDNQ